MPKVSTLGLVTIPKETREKTGINPGDELVVIGQKKLKKGSEITFKKICK